MKVQEHFELLNYNTSILRTPFTIAHILVTLIIAILISVNGATVIETLLFIVGCILLSVLHWYGNKIYIRLGTFYLLIQSLIVLLSSLFVHDFAIIVLIVFGGTLITQSFYLYNKAKKFVAFLVFYIVYGFFMLSIMYEQYKLDYAIFIFLISLLFILLGFATFNQKEVENRELLLANKRIEALTKQNERQRMARDLHDSLIQRLIGVNLKMEVMDEYLEDGDVKEAGELLKLAKTQVEQSIVEAREVVDDLRLSEEIMLNHRLVKEVANLKTLFSIPIEMKLEDNIVVDEEIANHIIAILKEAVTNTFKHARAKVIQVKATIEHNFLIFEIEDDGVGYTRASGTSHYGIIGMRERTELLNGQFNIFRKIDKGTKIIVKIPL
ncbi:sensor histidine kinase [Solibacillus sp. FSL R5-0449]|uniref:sensor histidine kinase n=1 Tax=Solibacillus sp. FSL R5-0449 TaxID=2921639 RepID=UPI0030CA90E2